MARQGGFDETLGADELSGKLTQRGQNESPLGRAGEESPPLGRERSLGAEGHRLHLTTRTQ